MGLTLLEAAKLNPGKVIKNAIIELYAGSSDILMVMPFEDIQGNALSYNREGTYPGVGFRGVNEGYTPSTGMLNPQTESLVIAGGDLDVDKFIIDTQGANQRSVQEAMKVKALSLAWTNKFFNGDSETEKREFDGLKKRIVGSQKIAAGSTANGTALSLATLDEAIDQTVNPTHIVMSKKMRRRLTQAARDYSIHNITWEKDAFGRQIAMYNDLPILTVDLDNVGSSIIPWTEACTSGTATGTSIYVLSFGSDALTGIQNGGVDVRDLGELEGYPKFRTRVEWYNGIASYHGRAATRIWSIADAAVTK